MKKMLICHNVTNNISCQHVKGKEEDSSWGFSSHSRGINEPIQWSWHHWGNNMNYTEVTVQLLTPEWRPSFSQDDIQYHVLCLWMTPVPAVDVHVLVSTDSSIINMLTCFTVSLVEAEHPDLLLIQKNKGRVSCLLCSFCTKVGKCNSTWDELFL